MAEDLVEQLQQLVVALTDLQRRSKDPAIIEPLDKLEAAAEKIGHTWSGSFLGYQSCVYYEGFASPPAGAHFSAEWGLTGMGMMGGTVGNWVEFKFGDVIEAVERLAGDPDIAPAKTFANEARDVLEVQRLEARSILSAWSSQRPDSYLAELQESIDGIISLTPSDCARAMLPSSFMSRDPLAYSQGPQISPHHQVLAEVYAVRSSVQACEKLGRLCAQAVGHMARLTSADPVTLPASGSRAFIGHGRSPLWRELKDFIQDRLELEWDEFNRVPVAGITNVSRLEEMLNSAGIGFLILTAEDQMTEGESLARQNVIHEAGLFQGRLGFSRAIVMLEDGCAEFSNIQGLGQIRFPAGNISAAFEEVRLVLEREGFLR